MRLSWGTRGGQLGDAEVGWIDVIGAVASRTGIDQNGGRFDIAVNKAAGVCGCQSVGGLVDDDDGPRQIERSATSEAS